MLMFLTRLGLEARAVVTGDTTQIDLPDPAGSGLIQACRILDGIEGIGIVRLTERDIVRHRLVRRIVAAYESSSPPGGEEAGDEPSAGEGPGGRASSAAPGGARPDGRADGGEGPAGGGS
jgi:phosphate starvation-inducible PhoH-like protein